MHPIILPRGLAAALMLLTRLPVPSPKPWCEQLTTAATAWYPVTGSIVAAIAGTGMALLAWGGVPWALCALVSVALEASLTGGMHEDGLADTADGLGGGTATARLAIMTDSRIGSHGTLALIFVIGIRATALAGIGESAGAAAAMMSLVAAGALSRAALPVLMRALPNARAGGLAAMQGCPKLKHVLLATGSSMLVTIGLLSPPTALLSILLAVLVGAGIGWLAARTLGGITGDVLGAAQQMVMAASLCGVATLGP